MTEAAEADPGWCEGHAAAMRTAYQRFPDDLDVAALFAESLMNVTPWQMWDLPTGEPADGAHTVECREVLERALATPEARVHPGVLHMYIHLMEMSPTPEAASEAADLLRDLVPDAGHLRHMPSHIDVLTGELPQGHRRQPGGLRGRPAVRRRRRRDERLHALPLPRPALPGLRRDVPRRPRAPPSMPPTGSWQAIPESLIRIESPPMADLLEGFVPIRVHVMIRFGMWEELIAEPLPDDYELFSATTAVVHYGRGVAYSATGRVAEAERERELFRAARARVPESRTLFNNTVADLLAIASEMLDGELLYRRGDHDEAFAALRRSIELDDHLPYDEPWGWMQPTRHAYGALLLEQGHVEEAAAVYAADLGLDDSLPRALRHPNNVWSLHGYHECLTRLGRARGGCRGEGRPRRGAGARRCPDRRQLRLPDGSLRHGHRTASSPGSSGDGGRSATRSSRPRTPAATSATPRSSRWPGKACRVARVATASARQRGADELDRARAGDRFPRWAADG